ncbi:MAG TPA: V-type ATP synthase subunit A [Chitinophagales bacterium]|nr:V-type ATP synthase subunit A [Chitinophagales bacterium]HRK28774.1 V-type ATP synthase subunit A [Chitinophagales bacterium]
MNTTGFIKGIIANLLLIEPQGEVRQNEICYISADDQGQTLIAEVIKISGKTVYAQVFDSTRGIKSGAKVTFSGSMLEVALGPGLLSKNFDGLQNDLDKLEGLFLQRGQQAYPLDTACLWAFEPLAQPGAAIQAGYWLGEVQEHGLPHKIMAPFTLTNEPHTLQWIAPAGNYTITDTIAVLTNQNGAQIPVTMVQPWAVKTPLKAYRQKIRPGQLLQTGIRILDTLHPIMKGGTGFIPGPFGCGKTVLQQAIAKQADADVVVVAACGERANELVDIFTEFPELIDPRTGKQLIERTVIIGNTSSMPVSAREASVYTAMTICEYYRNMGLSVLLLADSTSRWAQALREMANRLEDLPGPDAYPVDLPAVISNFYARAGMVELYNQHTGAITFVGTVSPAGGNFKEPVTEATKKATRCFYALSQRRADSKRYPAIDPIESYSKYIEYPEFARYIAPIAGNTWLAEVQELKNILLQGKDAADQINILGDDGVSTDFHLHFWRAELLDFVLLQQDAFDAIDQLTPLNRQQYMTRLCLTICRQFLTFDDFVQVRSFFKKLINALRQMNYTPFQSDEFNHYNTEALEMLQGHQLLQGDAPVAGN